MWSFCSSGPAWLFSTWGLWNANHFSSHLFFSVSSDSSSNYIRQLETKVRILEDDNNKLLSQVRCTHICALFSCSLFLSLTDVWVALLAQSGNIWTYTLLEFVLCNFTTHQKTCDKQLQWYKVVALMPLWSHPLTTACLLVGEYVYSCLIHGESVSFNSKQWC